MKWFHTQSEYPKICIAGRRNEDLGNGITNDIVSQVFLFIQTSLI